jgi:hypothetical protein
MRNLALGLLILALGLPILSPPTLSQETAAQETQDRRLQLQDRILAVVDEDPILVSDLERLIGLGLAAQQAGEEEPAFRRRVLDDLINQRLRFREVERFGFEVLPLEVLEEQAEAIATRFPSRQAFEGKLRELGLNQEGLRELLARQLLVLTYVEERLGTRIFVGQDDIEAYYRDTLAPRMRREQVPVPPVEDVREQIRTVIREQRLNEEIERWTSDLQQGADIQIFFEEPAQEDLPPVADPP